jgi:hypothetical protein
MMPNAASPVYQQGLASRSPGKIGLRHRHLRAHEAQVKPSPRVAGVGAASRRDCSATRPPPPRVRCSAAGRRQKIVIPLVP